MATIKDKVRVIVEGVTRISSEVFGNEWPTHPHHAHTELDHDDHEQYMLCSAGPDRPFTGRPYINTGLALRGAVELRFDDYYRYLHSLVPGDWTEEGIRLSWSAAEWQSFYDVFGDTSLLGAFIALYGVAANEYTGGVGINISAENVVSLEHLGLEDLTGPGADRILFWDNSESAVKWLTPNTGLSISGTNLNCTVSGGVTDHGALDGLPDDDHTQYILVAGTRAFTGDQSHGGHDVTNIGNLLGVVSGTAETGLGFPSGDLILSAWDDTTGYSQYLQFEPSAEAFLLSYDIDGEGSVAYLEYKRPADYGMRLFSDLKMEIESETSIELKTTLLSEASILITPDEELTIFPGTHTSFSDTGIQNVLYITHGDELGDGGYATGVASFDLSTHQYHQLVLDTGDVGTTLFTNPPTGSALVVLHISASGDDRIISGFPANVYWSGADDLTANTYTIPEDHWVDVVLRYDAENDKYYAWLEKQYGDAVAVTLDIAYDGGGAGLGALAYTDAGPVHFNSGTVASPNLYLTQTQAAFTGNQFQISNAATEAASNTIFFTGAAGEGDNVFGHRIFSQDAVSMLTDLGTGDEARRAYCSLQHDYENEVTTIGCHALLGTECGTDYEEYYAYFKAYGFVSTVGSNGNGIIEAKSSQQATFWSGASYATLRGYTNAHVTADTGYVDIDPSTYTQFNNKPLRDILNASFGPSSDTDSWNAASKTWDASASTPDVRITQTVNLTTLTITRPAGHGEVYRLKVYASGGDMEVGNASGCFKDATTAATFITWFGGDGNPDTEVLTIPSGTYADIAIKWENVSGTPVASGTFVLSV